MRTSSTDALSGSILLLVRGRPKSACRVVVTGSVYNFYPYNNVSLYNASCTVFTHYTANERNNARYLLSFLYIQRQSTCCFDIKAVYFWPISSSLAVQQLVIGDPAVLTCGASVLSLEHSLGGRHDMRRGDAVLVQQRGGRAGARHLLHVHVVDHDVPL